MNESLPQNNISDFELARARKENQKVQLETQEDENMVRVFIQHNPELLLPFIRTNEGILNFPGINSSEKTALRMYLYKIVMDIFDSVTPEEAVAQVEASRESLEQAERSDNFNDVLQDIENLTSLYLDHINGSAELDNEVVSLHGNNLPEGFSNEEAYTNRITVFTNKVQEFYKHAESSSVKTEEANFRTTLLELDNQARNLIEEFEVIETLLKKDNVNLSKNLIDRFKDADTKLGTILKFVTNTYNDL